MELADLPGGDLVAQGLRDLAAGQESDEALLVLVGSPRLRSLGIKVPASRLQDPEHRLYERLARTDSDSAHSRYNALIRRLVSFERAAECATSQQGRAASRAGWHVSRHLLGQEPGPNLSASTTAEERLEMMWPLALEAWTLTGRPLPDNRRSTMPVERRRLVDVDRESD